MFVVFEGIDGGGKTTLSNLVAERLRARDLRVEHMRKGGKFVSSVTQAMRELGRDARNLALTPRAELMLYLAREVQLVEEATRPALARADIVIADRFVYTAEVLARHGRGMAAAEVAPLVAAATDLVPALVILVDVDPQIARARRRIAKLIARENKPASRKGLAGTALQFRLRAGYLELAARDCERWIVIDNSDANLDATADAIADMIDTARVHGVAAARTRLVAPSPPRPTVHDPASAKAALLAWIDRRSEREPALAAYFLGDVPGPEFDARRAALAERVPSVIAAGLRWLDDAAAMQLRHRLADVAPRDVAISLAGHAGPRAGELLRALAPRAPHEVADALRGRDDELAWEIRALLPADALMTSLANVRGERGWALRERWLADRGATIQADRATAILACISITGLGDARAWQIREALRETAPVSSLESTLLLIDDRAWQWRERLLARAPKTVMKTIIGVDDPRAWALREHVASHCEEAIASTFELDAERAWALRAAAIHAWPATTIKSMGRLARTAPGGALVATALARHPSDVALWRQVTIRAA